MTADPPSDPDAALLEAVAESLDRTLVAHSRVSSQISGDGIVNAHQVEFEAPDGIRESHLLYLERRTEPAEVTSQRADEREGVLTMREEESGDQVAVWVYPRDPALPALQAAVFPDGAAVILQRLGADAGAAVTLELKAYRPGKRAVIRVETGRAVVFLKVLAPGAAGPLAHRHNLWLEAGLPVPPVLGWSDEGLLALSALGGVPATDAVGRLDPDRFTTEIARLQARIAEVASTDAARASLASRLAWYERRLAHIAPAHASKVHAIARRIESGLASTAHPAPVTIHGDLHIGQLFLDPTTDAVAGLLDIDTAGLGDPADDAAALYAHLIVTGLINAGHPAVSAGCEALAARWREHWRESEDPAFAQRATSIAATHLLAHALNELLDTAVLVEHAEALLANIREL